MLHKMHLTTHKNFSDWVLSKVCSFLLVNSLMRNVSQNLLRLFEIKTQVQDYKLNYFIILFETIVMLCPKKFGLSSGEILVMFYASKLLIPMLHLHLVFLRTKNKSYLK